MVRKEEIGNIYVVRINGVEFKATISQDPSQYKFYSDLGLDVFVKSEREEVIELLNHYNIEYRPNSKTETLKRKLNDHLAESND